MKKTAINFPNYPAKYKDQSLLNAQDIIGYRRQLKRMPDVPNLEGVLLCLERGLPRRLRWKVPVRLAGSMNGDLYAVKKTNDRVAVMTGFGGGAPITAELAEEFIAMGAKRLVLMTWGGALQPDLHAGDIVVCGQAIRDEGTSHHYLPAGKTISASSELADRLVNSIRRKGGTYSTGCTWTTDAPYRETLAEVRQYQSEGVKTVEMESAGLFAVGQVRDVQTAAVVVIMDSLAQYTWQAPENLNAIQHSLETVYTAAIEALAG